MKRAAFFAALFALAATSALAEPSPALVAKARAILAKAPIIDGHNDLPWEIFDKFGGDPAAAHLEGDTRKGPHPLHTDLDRLRQGGVGGQFWSVWIPAGLSGPQATSDVLREIDIVRRMIAAYPDRLAPAITADDIAHAWKAGKVASLIGIEGGAAIDGKLFLIREFRRAGVGYMTLTHSKTIPWADSATDDPASGGLSPFGEQVVAEMNRVGMLVDLSHVSAETMKDALRVTRAPVIFSHSSARAVDGHPRNVPDDVLAMLPANGGVVMVNVYAAFVSEPLRQWNAATAGEEARLKSLNPGDPKSVQDRLKAWIDAHPKPHATLEQVADHVDHIRKVAGIDHVGIGGDYDGIDDTPVQMPGVETYPLLIAELLSRGWSEADIAKLTSGNILRVMRQAEAAAERLKSEPPALDAAAKPAA